MLQARSPELSAHEIRKIEAKVAAACDLDRVVRITVQGLLKIPEFKSVKSGYVSFTRRQGSDVRDVLDEIYRQLPTTDQDILILTAGSRPTIKLHECPDAPIVYLMDTFDAKFVLLTVQLLKPEAEQGAEAAKPKKGFRKLFTRGAGTGDVPKAVDPVREEQQDAAYTPQIMPSAPPSYEESLAQR